MYIAMNRFQVREDQGDVFEEAWANRERHLDTVPGFLAFRLLRGEGGVYISHSTWESEAAFVGWTESEAFRKAHGQRLPEGVLAGPPTVSGYDVVLAEERSR